MIFGSGDRGADDWAPVVQRFGNCGGQECTSWAIEDCQLDGYNIEWRQSITKLQIVLSFASIVYKLRALQQMFFHHLAGVESAATFS